MRQTDQGAGIGGLHALLNAGTSGPLTDGELLDRFAAARAEAEWAFAALVGRHGPMVLATCRRILGDDHLAEDACQATFLVLARRAETVRDGAALPGWLHRIARRVANRSRVRSDRRRRRERPAVEVAAPHDGDRAERAEIRALVDAEVDRLGDAFRLPIVLCDLQGRTHEEAADLLRCPVGTIKSRLSRGRTRLRDRLARRGFAAPALLPAGFVAPPPAAVPAALAARTARLAVTYSLGRSAAALVAGTAARLASKELLAMTLARWTSPLAIAAVALAAGAAAFTFDGRPVPADPDQPTARPAATPSARGPEPPSLNASGRVVDAAGGPVAGATVLIREWSSWRARAHDVARRAGLERGELVPDVLGQTRTDAEGRFDLADVPARPFPGQPNVGRKTFPYDLVVLADGHGVAHEHLTPINQARPLTLTLPAERVVAGRVAEPGGRPVAGARVAVLSVGRIGRDAFVLTEDETLQLAWSSVPLAATTDAEGRFHLRGLPIGVQVDLSVRAAGHSPDFLTCATIDQPPPDQAVIDMNPGVAASRPKPPRTGDLAVELKRTDHRLAGRVVFAADGKPAAGRGVFRSFAPVATTDADGRFVVDGLPVGPFDLHIAADETGAAPLAVRVEMPADPLEVARSFELPRGVVVAGTVTDEATGRGVEGVEVRYDRESAPGSIATIFGISAKTDRAGKYRLVAPAGRGAVDVASVPPNHPPLPDRSTRAVGSDPYGLVVAGIDGESVTADFAIPHGRSVVLRTVNAGGKPVAGAEVRLMKDPGSLKVVGRTDAGGRVEVSGLDPAARHTLDITDEAAGLGARVIVSEQPTEAPRDVRLAPLRPVAGRVLDDSGRPLAGVPVTLYATNDPPARSGLPAEEGATNRDGRFRLARLIEGVEYSVHAYPEGFAHATSRPFVVQAGATPDVPEFRLPAATRTLDGVVVDPRGVRLAGVSVAIRLDLKLPYTSAGREGAETDARGDFHFDGLPEVEVEVMAYRDPGAAGGPIRNMGRLKVWAGAGQVRLVLPDPDERPRQLEN